MNANVSNAREEKKVVRREKNGEFSLAASPLAKIRCREELAAPPQKQPNLCQRNPAECQYACVTD